MMKKHGWTPKKGQPTVTEFGAFVEAARLKESGEKPELEKDLKDWNKGKINDSEMMLDIENAVAGGGVNAEMLHEGETSKEGAEMLEMDQSDREFLCRLLARRPLTWLLCVSFLFHTRIISIYIFARDLS